MKHIVINRLIQSFGELEKAIVSARSTLEENQDTPRDILDRIDVYDEILEKQRILTTKLSAYAAEGDWREVSRHVQLINALSAMIRDDAREILTGVKAPVDDQQKEMMLV